MRETLGPITTTCDSVSFKGATMTELEFSTGSTAGCAKLSVRNGMGCLVGDGNQLLNCTDTHALCAPPPFPPIGAGDPSQTCSISTAQSFFLNGYLLRQRAHTYTFVQTATSCTLTVN